jgi:hypothetical protein
MVICAQCKAYTDDQQSHCRQCGAPLQPDRMERVAAAAHNPELARLAEDQGRARLVASSVVALNVHDFFYDAGQARRTVLVRLLGSKRDPYAPAAGVVFAAYVYLFQNEYCAARRVGRTQVAVQLLRPWDGQAECLEALLATQVDFSETTREATERLLQRLTGVEQPASGGRVRRRRLADRSAVAAVEHVARVTVLPPHQPQEACGEVYRMLASFVAADEGRARVLTLETRSLLEQFDTAS